jgi:hypothetical protein
MKSAIAGAVVGAMAMAGLAGTTVIGGRAEAQGRQAFKYAYVVAKHDQSAEICYAEAEGCRIVRVTADPVRLEGGTIIDASATARKAVVKAVAGLGDGGWELIGPGQPYGQTLTEQALFFRLAER